MSCEGIGTTRDVLVVIRFKEARRSRLSGASRAKGLVTELLLDRLINASPAFESPTTHELECAYDRWADIEYLP